MHEQQDFPEFYGMPSRDEKPVARWPIVYNCVTIFFLLLIYSYFLLHKSPLAYYNPDWEEWLLLLSPYIVGVTTIFLLAFRLMAGWIIMMLLGIGLVSIYALAVFDTIWHCIKYDSWYRIDSMLGQESFQFSTIGFALIAIGLGISLNKRIASLWKAGRGLRIAMAILIGVGVLLAISADFVFN